MIITREQQEKILANYMKTHSTIECTGFVDGINATIELINKIKKDQDEAIKTK
jgi:cob(I)alamin adenosyltransferase